MGSLFYKTLNIILNLFVKIYDFSQKYGKINFRYKRYYYDKETKLYYCNARYYNPDIYEWLTPDDIGYLDIESVNGLNLYCYCGNNPVMCSLGCELGEISVPISNFVPSYSNINSKSNDGISKVLSREIFTAQFANVVGMTNYSTPLVDNISFGMVIGNISHTITTQHNNAGMFYFYSNIGNSTSSVGVGFNPNSWCGANVYVSSNIGIGSSMQITPYITFGAEVSILDGISFSFGTISRNVTSEITVSIGWGTLAFACAACGVIAATPVPMARVAACVALCVVLLIDIFN